MKSGIVVIKEFTRFARWVASAAVEGAADILI